MTKLGPPLRIFLRTPLDVWVLSLQCIAIQCQRSTQYHQGRHQRGATGARHPRLKSVPAHFTFGPLVAAYFPFSILKMWPPFGFWPLLVFAPLLLNPGDEPEYHTSYNFRAQILNIISRQNITSAPINHGDLCEI